MDMEAIQDAIKALGRAKQRELLEWLRDWDDWDQQMYEDAASERLDRLASPASAGETEPMPETDEAWERRLREPQSGEDASGAAA